MKQAPVLKDEQVKRLLKTTRITRHPARNRLVIILSYYVGLKAQRQCNKVSAVNLRKNDTAANKKTELRSMTSLLESKINQGKEVTLIVVESH